MSSIDGDACVAAESDVVDLYEPGMSFIVIRKPS
jgi:hypothetical protein